LPLHSASRDTSKHNIGGYYLRQLTKCFSGSNVGNENDCENHQYNDDEYVNANEDVATNEIGEDDGIDGIVADAIGQDIGAHEGMVADDEPFAPRVRITRQRTLWGGYWKHTETTTANRKIIIQHLLHTNQTFPSNIAGHNPDNRPSDIPKA
jgi:hypothetical protein